jgi:uncharacterized protein YdeI (YjbR/CyaY-like superfamily)
MPRDLPQVQPKSRRAWRSWLQKHHDASAGVWLVYAKKHTGIPSLTYSAAVEEALCFGWIDSLVHPIDDDFYRQIFTPRKPRSAWSAVNRKRVEQLVAAGLMTAAGLASITHAKKTRSVGGTCRGRIADHPTRVEEGAHADPNAKKNWPTYTESQRKMFLYMVNGAKRPETRAKRIARVIEIVSSGMKFSQAVAGSTNKQKKT